MFEIGLAICGVLFGIGVICSIVVFIKDGGGKRGGF